METVVIGIRPTGKLHLGNYFGAVKSFIKMQEDYNCFFFIADWHSLTTHPHPENIRKSVKTILAEYLVACALDILRNVRGLWDRYDLITPEGITIEVKSSGYLQSWGQEHLSTISFGIAPTLGWDDKTNTYEYLY